MEEFTRKDIDMFMSRESMIELGLITSKFRKEDISDYINSYIFERFLNERPEIKEYVNLYSNFTGLGKLACLAAHGDTEFNEWTYEDEGQEKLVQDWINDHDGDYSALLLCVCNQSGLEIESKKSLVLAPNYIFGTRAQYFEGGQVDLYVPNKGYIDSYEFDEEINKLKEKIIKKKR